MPTWMQQLLNNKPNRNFPRDVVPAKFKGKPEFPPVEERKRWTDYPEFLFACSMQNEVHHSLKRAVRYLDKNIKRARMFDVELADNLQEFREYAANVWDFLLEYQEDVLKPYYAKLFADKPPEEGEEEEEEIEDE